MSALPFNICGARWRRGCPLSRTGGSMATTDDDTATGQRLAPPWLACSHGQLEKRALTNPDIYNSLFDRPCPRYACSRD